MKEVKGVYLGINETAKEIKFVNISENRNINVLSLTDVKK